MQSTPPKHSDTRSALRRMTAAASLFVLTTALPAHAYLGEKMLAWAKTNLLIPMGLIFVVLAGATAMIKPAMAAQAVYALIAAIVLLFIISAAPQIMTAMQ